MNNPFEIPLTDEQESEPVKAHTPAPWTSCRWDDETVAILDEGKTTRIAWVFETVDDEANTRLITKAPLLYELARQIVLAAEEGEGVVPSDILLCAKELTEEG